MPAQRKYPDELRERAVKMVFEVRERDGKGHGERREVTAQSQAVIAAELCRLGRLAEARLQSDGWVEHAVITGEWWV
jgi:hypothetical protein